MRAGQFTDSYLPIVNGVSTFIHLFKQSLEKLEVEPCLFTFGHTRYADREPNVVRSPGWPLGKTGYHFALNHSRRAQALAETMDVLHTHHPFLSGALAARISRRQNKPLIFTNHTRYDHYSRYYLPFLPRRVALSLLGAWMRRFARACDLIIAVSAAAEAMLKSLHVCAPIAVIPNGIDLDRFARVQPMQRSDLALPPDGFLFMYVGRLGPEKNLERLLEAFGQARFAAPHITLAIVGDGPQASALRKRTQESGLSGSVRFVGARSIETIPSLLGAADAFVTASVTESHPMTVIEALAAGRPVLGFDVPGIRETVSDGVDGLLAQSDPQALGERMAQVALDRALCARLSAGARRSARQYDIGATTRRIVAHYERLIRERKR